MAVYRNTRTGAEISTECEISGPDWVRVDPQPAAAEKPEKKSKKKG